MKEGVRNFFFFLLGDLLGELSGVRASSIFSPPLTAISTLSALVVSWLTRLLRSSSASCAPSFPFGMPPAWFSAADGSRASRRDWVTAAGAPK
ncbi:hypothetical protein SKAU_G00142920 [Synaphobranchus kaupii]|uniref:Secreted protein n=1 Tax=Synaphobranchus kaupii TaxID=118154 RepID=A0A9Q1FT91_SYNKA|nr:hypothetical protein SKAU_G00142920 [Synaphobranchus kaupii]